MAEDTPSSTAQGSWYRAPHLSLSRRCRYDTPETSPRTHGTGRTLACERTLGRSRDCKRSNSCMPYTPPFKELFSKREHGSYPFVRYDGDGFPHRCFRDKKPLRHTSRLVSHGVYYICFGRFRFNLRAYFPNNPILDFYYHEVFRL